MPLDPDARAYLDAIAPFPAVDELPVEQARANTEAGAKGLFGPVADVATTEDRAVPGPNGPVRVRIYRPPGADGALPGLVYFHGGGWVIGSLDTHDGVCRALCAGVPCVVVSVDYRLAPEHRFPAAVEDAWAAAAWTAERARELGLRPDALAVGGDSAGGNLAAVVALRARDHGLPLAAQLLVYPVTDTDLETGSYRDYGTGYGLTRAAMAWFFDHYLGPGGDRAHPEVAPLRAADLGGVAPALVQTAEYDPLRDEGEAYARRLADAGVPVTLTRYDGLVHAYVRMPGTLRRAAEALGECSAFLRSRLGG